MAGPLIKFDWKNNCNNCNSCHQSSYSNSLVTRRVPVGYRALHLALGLQKGDKISAHRLAYLAFRVHTQDQHLPQIVMTTQNLPHFTNYVCYRFLREKATTAAAVSTEFKSNLKQANDVNNVKNVFELADKLWQDSPITKTLGGILWMISRESTLQGGNVAHTEEDAFNLYVVRELAKEVWHELPLKLFSTAVKYDRIVPTSQLESKNNQLERTTVVNFLCRKVFLSGNIDTINISSATNSCTLLARNSLVWELVMQRKIFLDDLVTETLKCANSPSYQYPRRQTQIMHIAVRLVEIGGKEVADQFFNFFRKRRNLYGQDPRHFDFLKLVAEALVNHGKLVDEIASCKRIHEQIPTVLAALTCEYWNFSVPQLTIPVNISI